VDLDELQALVDHSVGLRLRSDVPLGAFLSGGVDSSVVTASAQAQSSRPIQTFTISTGESWCDESVEASVVAAHLGTDHHCFTVQPDLVDVSAKLARHYGQPFADYSLVPTFYVSRETRRCVTVALSGDGGDELFAGYERYATARWSRLFGVVPDDLRPMLAALGRLVAKRIGRTRKLAPYMEDFILAAGDPRRRGENYSYLFHDARMRQAFQPTFLRRVALGRAAELAVFARHYDEAASDVPLERWLEADQRMHLADDILCKVDVASMAVSLECRAPLLDHRLAEHVNSLPLAAKLAAGRSKAALRDIAARRVPAVIAGLPKKGFTLPLAQWMRHELRDWSRATIFEGRDAWVEYCRPEVVERFWRQHQSGRVDHSMRLWSLIAFVLWDKARRRAARERHAHS